MTIHLSDISDPKLRALLERRIVGDKPFSVVIAGHVLEARLTSFSTRPFETLRTVGGRIPMGPMVSEATLYCHEV